MHIALYNENNVLEILFLKKKQKKNGQLKGEEVNEMWALFTAINQ